MSIVRIHFTWFDAMPLLSGVLQLLLSRASLTAVNTQRYRHLFRHHRHQLRLRV